MISSEVKSFLVRRYIYFMEYFLASFASPLLKLQHLCSLQTSVLAPRTTTQVAAVVAVTKDNILNEHIATKLSIHGIDIINYMGVPPCIANIIT